MSIHRNSRGGRLSKAILVGSAVLVVALGLCGVYFHKLFFGQVLNLAEGEKYELYIPTGAEYEDVVGLLKVGGKLKDEASFRTMSSLMSYGSKVRPGCYVLTSDMSARRLVTVLRNGLQTPVKFTFNNVRTLERLAAVMSQYIEADSLEIVTALRNQDNALKYGMTVETLPAMFLPDTYEVWWNTTPTALMDRMHKEYENYWNDERLRLASAQGLTPVEVSTLASIVEEETNVAAEQPIVAGLYLNRLRSGMRLEACPTLKFALGDFTIKRVLSRDKEIDSPYNTYKNSGLPPGPIRIPSKRAIEAVLSPTRSEYIFMCAKPDGSGTHAFARTLAQHNKNAAEYQRWLNDNKIYR